MDTSETHPCPEYVAELIDRIGSYDDEVLLPAVTVLSNMGPPVVEFLIAAAAEYSTPIEHQYRLLNLARRIGGQRGPAENRCLRRLGRHWCPVIREKVNEVLAALTPRRRARKSGAASLVQGADASPST
jgi:hypothetical protein